MIDLTERERVAARPKKHGWTKRQLLILVILLDVAFGAGLVMGPIVFRAAQPIETKPTHSEAVQKLAREIMERNE